MGWGLEVLKCFVSGESEFFLLASCVWDGGDQVQYLSSVKKITDLLLLINKSAAGIA